MSNTLELELATICDLIDLSAIGVAARSGCNLDILLDGLVVRRSSSSRRVSGSSIGGASCPSAAAERSPWISGWRGTSSASSAATTAAASTWSRPGVIGNLCLRGRGRLRPLGPL